jgi:hypothetical protein
MNPPFPAHNLLHKANRYGLASLANLDKLPAKGAILIAAPLKIVNGTGSRSARWRWFPGLTADGADHVIIGSGINALVAAAALALEGRQGPRARAQRPISAAACAPRRSRCPAFVHDVMATTFVLFLTSPAFAALGPGSCPPWARILPYAASDRRAAAGWVERVVLTTDRAANVARWTRSRRATATACRGCRRDRGRCALLFAPARRQLWSWQTRSCCSARRWRRGPRGLAAWLGEALQPARGWLETGYRRPGCAGALCALGAALRADARKTPIRPDGKVIAFALEAAGAPIVKGGCRQSAAQAFRALIEENAAAIRTGADVDRIDRQFRRPCGGVRLATGEEIACRGLPRSRRGSSTAAAWRGCACAEDREAVTRFPPWPRRFPAALRARPPAGMEDARGWSRSR